MLQQRGFAMSPTSGSSMRPLIWGGVHSVVVTPLDEEPRVGDILMFAQTIDNRVRLVVHRLVEIEGDGCCRVYITRGDNCLNSERVRHDEIIGRITEIHRIGRYRPWHIIPFRKIAISDLTYRLYTRLWMALWPLRRQCFRLLLHAQSALQRLRRRSVAS